MNLSKEDILSYLKEKKEELIHRFQLTKIGLFGSFARDEQNYSSDIDLIVEFEPGTEELYEKKQELKELIGRDLNSEVDLCREKYIKPYFRRRILRDAIFV